MLYLETATQPLQVFSVLELDTATIPGGYSFDRLRDDAVRADAGDTGVPGEAVRQIPEPRSSRLGRGQRLRHRPSRASDRPSGTRRLGGARGDLRTSGRFAARPSSDRCGRCGSSRASTARRRRTAGRHLKVHHAAADGVTYANLLSRLCSTEPDSPPPDSVPAAAVTTPLRIAIDGLVRFASRPLQLAVKVLPATTASGDRHRPARGGAAGRWQLRSPPRGPCSTAAHRAIATSPSPALDLDDVKKVKNHFGVKVNDVAMAAGRRAVPASSCSTAVNCRSPPWSRWCRCRCTDASDCIGAKPGFGHLRETADPDRGPGGTAAERSPRRAPLPRNTASAIGATLLQDCGQLVGPVLLGVAKRVYARLTQFRPMYNIVVSNVPGPTDGRYFLGAEVLAMYPFGPVMHGAGLNITLWSVNGTAPRRR